MDFELLSMVAGSVKLDLHGLSRDEAEFELVRCLNLVDANVKAIEVVHGYHKGTVLKKLVRESFKHPLIEKKVPIDASRTLFVLDFNRLKKF